MPALPTPLLKRLIGLNRQERWSLGLSLLRILLTGFLGFLLIFNFHGWTPRARTLASTWSVVLCTLLALTSVYWFLHESAHFARKLRSRGYQWARWWNSVALLELEWKAPYLRQLPRQEHLAAVPGFQDTPDGLILFLESINRSTQDPEK